MGLGHVSRPGIGGRGSRWFIFLGTFVTRCFMAIGPPIWITDDFEALVFGMSIHATFFTFERLLYEPWRKRLRLRIRLMIYLFNRGNDVKLIPSSNNLLESTLSCSMPQYFFSTLGFKNDASLYSAVITGAVNVLSTFVGIYFVDKLGRPFLLLQAGVQMFFAQLVIAIILGFKVTDTSENLNSGFAKLVMITICTFVLAIAWSWGLLGWLIPTKTFPLETRSAEQSITVCINLVFTFIIAQVFLSMICHFKYGIFLFFSGWVLIKSIFVWFLVPETKNIPIKEMTERVWKQHWLWKRFMDDDEYSKNDLAKKNGVANHDL
uniref:Sugar transport protein 13 n=1 Tax=Tanacetum cinerariifolium TaxID=118510 RepID=A0A699IDF5_TANCI|nr:sugar transport protein 13 [Tanacetum cinerariifolium]